MPVFPILGDLEVAILEHAWRHPDTTAKDTHVGVGIERAISLNTIQSTLERLVRKDLLARHKVGHCFHYSPRLSRDEVIGAIVRDTLGRFGGNPSAAVATFIEMADVPDEETLRLLEKKLRSRDTRKRS